MKQKHLGTARGEAQRRRPRMAGSVRSLLMACLSLVTLEATAQMSTPGQFNVSPSGAATYQIPLKIPPGVAGVQPELSLAYSSQQGDGLLGIGWTLSGLSAISRCPQTLAQDGLRGSVNFDSDDRYCLDGQRLLATRDPANANAAVGGYGADGTFYTTEIEGFNKIQSFGLVGSGTAATGSPYYGPSYFVVKSKAGLTMEYGYTTDARVLAAGLGAGKTVVRLWQLNKITDSKGNSVTITYSAPDSVNGQSYPLQIAYTSNSTVNPPLSAKSAIVFDYNNTADGTPVARSYPFPVYQAGSVIQTTVRMTKISMLVSGQVVREYRIAYRTPESRNVIKSIQECAPNSICLPATDLTWSPSVTSWSDVSSWSGGPSPGTPIGNQCLTGDYDGDSRTDLACYTGTAGSWHVALANLPDRWTASIWSGGTGPGSTWRFSSGAPVGNECFTGDFNGDQRTDIACYPGLGGTWHVSLSTGSGWSSSPWTGGNAPGTPVGNQCIAADVDGDGKTDIACYTGSSDYWVFSFSTGSGWRTGSAQHAGNAVGPSDGNNCFSGDYNGDGKTDLACSPGDTDVWVMSLSTTAGTGWVGATWNGGNGPGIPIGAQCFSGDFNGDGKSDIACTNGNTGTWYVQLSTGTGWSMGPWGNGPAPGTPIGDQCMAADLNGDGKTDIACFTGGNAAWVVGISMGSRWLTMPWSGNNPGTPIGAQCVPGNFRGDGKMSFMCYPGGGTTWVLAAPPITQYASLDRISNVLGMTISPTYSMPSRLLGDRFTQTQAVTAPQYLTTPMGPVVTDVDISDGVGGTRRTSYWYDSFVSEIGTGRGGLGYKTTRSLDTRSGIQSSTTFRLDFPYIGLIDTATTTTQTGSMLSTTTNTYACLDPAASLSTPCVIPPSLPTQPVTAKGYFVYPSSIKKLNRDLNGADLPGTRTTNANPDAFGNFQTVSTVTLNPGGSDSEYAKTVTNTYYNDPAKWHLGRLVKSVVAASSPTVAAPVVPGSGAGTLPPTPSPQLPPQLLLPILNLLLDD
jgi:hypothetical protein